MTALRNCSSIVRTVTLQNKWSQFTDSLNPVGWQTLTNLFGNGALLQVTDEPLTNAQRFYRVKTP